MKEWFELMFEHDIQPNIVTINTLMHAAVLRRAKRRLSIGSTRQSLNVAVDAVTYNSIISALSKRVARRFTDTPGGVRNSRNDNRENRSDIIEDVNVINQWLNAMREAGFQPYLATYTEIFTAQWIFTKRTGQVIYRVAGKRWPGMVFDPI